MFTGIIDAVGQIVAADAQPATDGGGLRLAIEVPAGYLDDVHPGDSIALSGACMTVTDFDAGAARFAVDISAESLARTAGLDRPGAINLEKAMRPQDRLGGHLVTGHVDGFGEVVSLRPVGESHELIVRAPTELARFIAYKGSVTVDGASLTVNRVADGPAGCELSINLIPHTLQQTTLGRLVAGRRVNLEIDLIARYVERMLSAPAPATRPVATSTAATPNTPAPGRDTLAAGSPRASA